MDPVELLQEIYVKLAFKMNINFSHIYTFLLVLFLATAMYLFVFVVIIGGLLDSSLIQLSENVYFYGFAYYCVSAK